MRYILESQSNTTQNQGLNQVNYNSQPNQVQWGQPNWNNGYQQGQYQNPSQYQGQNSMPLNGYQNQGYVQGQQTYGNNTPQYLQQGQQYYNLDGQRKF